MIQEDGDNENGADPGTLSGGRSRSRDRNDNDEGKDEEDTQGSERGTGKMKGVKDGKG